MKRVVITGMGINSCIGNSLEEVTHSLKMESLGHVLTQLMPNLISKAMSALLPSKILMVSTVNLNASWAYVRCMPTMQRLPR